MRERHRAGGKGSVSSSPSEWLVIVESLLPGTTVQYQGDVRGNAKSGTRSECAGLKGNAARDIPGQGHLSIFLAVCEGDLGHLDQVIQRPPCVEDFIRRHEARQHREEISGHEPIGRGVCPLQAPATHGYRGVEIRWI